MTLSLLENLVLQMKEGGLRWDGIYIYQANRTDYPVACVAVHGVELLDHSNPTMRSPHETIASACDLLGIRVTTAQRKTARADAYTQYVCWLGS